MSIQDEVDRLIDDRPGRELLNPDYDEKAVPLCDFIFRSSGTSASYMIVAGSERVIVNTGMGWEAPHHKHLFDAKPEDVRAPFDFYLNEFDVRLEVK